MRSSGEVGAMIRVGRSSGVVGVCRRWIGGMASPGDTVDSEIGHQNPEAPAGPLLRFPIPGDEAAGLQQRLNYRFCMRNHFYDALTHPSYPNRVRSDQIPDPWPQAPLRRSYKVLQPNGKFTLESRLTSHIFLTTAPGKDPDALCNVNLSPHKLARTALRLRLYDSLRRNCPRLDLKVTDFLKVQDGRVPYPGTPPKVPKVLTDLVEAMFGAVMLDSDCNDLAAWQTLQSQFTPIVYWNHMEQAVTSLREVCDEFKLRLVFKKNKYANLTTSHVLINNRLHGSGASEVEPFAELIAAMNALNRLPNYMLYATILDTPLSMKHKFGNF